MNLLLLRDLNDMVTEVASKYPDATIGELLANLIAVTLATAKQTNQVEFAGEAWNKTFEVAKNTDFETLVQQGQSFSN